MKKTEQKKGNKIDINPRYKRPYIEVFGDQEEQDILEISKDEYGNESQTPTCYQEQHFLSDSEEEIEEEEEDWSTVYLNSENIRLTQEVLKLKELKRCNVIIIKELQELVREKAKTYGNK